LLNVELELQLVWNVNVYGCFYYHLFM